jgi:hypothetical protein
MEKRCLQITSLSNPLELYWQLQAPMVYSKKQRQPIFSNYLKRNLQEPQRVSPFKTHRPELYIDRDYRYSSPLWHWQSG